MAGGESARRRSGRSDDMRSKGGDLDGLLALLRRVAVSEEKRAGLPVRVHVCFEAGRDGHWLYRALKAEGYDVYEIDAASVAVDRRARRVKSDGVDVDKLVRTLARLVRANSTPAGWSRFRARRRRTPSGRTASTSGWSRSVAHQPGESALVRARGARLRPERAGLAGAPGGAAHSAEAEGGAHPRMPPPLKDRRRHRRGRGGNDGGRRLGQKGDGERRGIIISELAPEPSARQDRAALPAQGRRGPLQHRARRRGLLS